MKPSANGRTSLRNSGGRRVATSAAARSASSLTALHHRHEGQEVMVVHHVDRVEAGRLLAGAERRAASASMARGWPRRQLPATGAHVDVAGMCTRCPAAGTRSRRRSADAVAASGVSDASIKWTYRWFASGCPGSPASPAPASPSLPRSLLRLPLRCPLVPRPQVEHRLGIERRDVGIARVLAPHRPGAWPRRQASSSGRLS